MVALSCTISRETTAFCSLLLMNKLKFNTNTPRVICTVWSYGLDKLLRSLIIDYESVLIGVFIYMMALMHVVQKPVAELSEFKQVKTPAA